MTEPREVHNFLTIETIAFFLLTLFVALNPFPHTTTVQQVSYYLSAILAGCFLKKKGDFKFLKTPFSLPMVFFAVWAFMGLFFALDVEHSIHDFRSHLLEYIVLYIVIVTFVNSQKRLMTLGWGLVLSTSIAAALELYKFYVVGDYPLSRRFIMSDPEYPVGAFGFMAMYAVIFALTLFRLQKNVARSLLLICLIPLLATVCCIQTRAILLAMPLVFGVLFWDKKRILSFFVLLSFFIGFVTLNYFRPNTMLNGISPRLTINYISYLLLKDHPVFGIGFGINTYSNPKIIDHKSYMAKVPERFRKEKEPISNPHNMIMDVAVRTGVLGLVLFMQVVFVGFREGVSLTGRDKKEQVRLWGATLTSTLVLFCIYGLFNAVFLRFIETLLCVSFSLISCVSRWQSDTLINTPNNDARIR